MSLFTELKRRNVFKVGAAYLVLAWIVIQITNAAVPALRLPDWVNSLVFLLGMLGFPFALFFAWVFELTPDGIKKESEIPTEESIAAHTGRKLDFIIIAMLVIALGYFIWESRIQQSPSSGTVTTSNTSTFANEEEQDKEVLLPAAKTSNKSIAVLPFTNMATDNKNESFALGIHDDLLTHLSKISALKVISRTSVLRYKSTEKPIAEIAQELGVENILEGSVQSAGQQIRINVQLIDAKTDEHLWAEIYDRKLTTENIFNIQTEISEKIATALKAQLSAEEKTSLAKQATNNLDAYNAYLAGRQRLLNRTSKELKQALVLFERATELDPNYALAYVGQADTLALLYEYSTLSQKEMLARGEPLIAKALLIDPLLAEAHTSKAQYLSDRGEYKAAEQSFKHSLTLNPNYATSYHWYTNLLNDLDRNQDALALSRKAALLDPMSPVIQNNIGWSLWFLGENYQALEQFKRVIEFAPDFPGAAWGISHVHTSMGQFDQAVLWIKRAIALDNGNVKNQLTLGLFYLNLGAVKGAVSILKQMQQQFPHHAYTEELRFLIYLYQGELNKLFKSIEQRYLNDPKNSSKQISYANALVRDGQYKKALPFLLILYADKDTGVININAENIDDIISLLWTYQQLGQEKQAQQLRLKVKQALSSLNGYTMDWSRILFEAVQGRYHLAGVAYAKLIDNNAYKQWWHYEKRPYFAEVKKQPEYIKAHRRLMDILKGQRENLAKLEAQGQTE